jgi:hypothetical protein
MVAMKPRIQYAKAADGVSIAFWTLGEGAPYVQMPILPWSHIQLEWQFPEVRRWWARRSTPAGPPSVCPASVTGPQPRRAPEAAT